ncbi:MAG: Rrf2 family transcriptional regulator [candidate division Zixibacteria bacterium]|nr:Rrf2 family transcriptional regulator [candidate division Zixibacteria bacterium]NIR65242.1 Rrf2 family transcriptional regulator [candidate division Zixibacteria bacterium]NIS16024.1 Rrf2 family transcriptional regulator [candidate division Zixibacteria bacterium]NIS46978.1 Rrf2 family transcriptional regulator [candidate division Zixibacteria bacterium]NIT52433.1 Rrf2 family transcriptional regulator [candidate division Zixibacteria bacterium]
MKVSALEEYGLRCMLQLARNNGGPMTLPEISEAEGLSLSYAGKLLMILKKAGLVKAVRGRQGGYALVKPAPNYDLKEIFDALGEPLYNPKHCRKYIGDLAKCAHTDDCTVREIWKGFSKLIDGVLGKVTLADLASGNYDFENLISNIEIITE